MKWLPGALSPRPVWALESAGHQCRSQPSHGIFRLNAFNGNQEGGAIAAVDLEVFAVARHIRVGMGRQPRCWQNPERSGICSHARERFGPRIRAGQSHLLAQLQVATTAIEMRLSPGRRCSIVLCQRPRQLVRLGVGSLEDQLETSLTGQAGGIRYLLRTDTARGSAPAPDVPLLSWISQKRQLSTHVGTTGEIGLVRFQPVPWSDLCAIRSRGN